jgi:hypothetical protein
VLEIYNGDSRADEYFATGTMSDYAKKIINRSMELERLHEK